MVLVLVALDWVDRYRGALKFPQPSSQVPLRVGFVLVYMENYRMRVRGQVGRLERVAVDTVMFRQYTAMEISQADSLLPVMFRRDVTGLEKRRLRRQQPRLHNVRALSVVNPSFGICR